MHLILPSNIEVSAKQHKNYAAFCVFKQYAGDRGFVDKKSMDKNWSSYWSKKLIALGWLERKQGGWTARSSRQVWSLMGCKRVYRFGEDRGIIGFHYSKILLDSKEKNQEMFKEALHQIRRHLVARKITHIKHRLYCAGVSKDNLTNQKPLFGVNAVARVLGYSTPSAGNSSSAGHKYRDLYFSVIRSPQHREERENEEGVIRWHFPCFRLDLDARLK